MTEHSKGGTSGAPLGGCGGEGVSVLGLPVSTNPGKGFRLWSLVWGGGGGVITTHSVKQGGAPRKTN